MSTKRPAGQGGASEPAHLPVTELLGEFQGANSPFGDDLRFPLPVSSIDYQHPEPPAVGDEQG